MIMNRLSLAGLAIISVSPILSAQQKPNVVIFMTDDQGAIDLNCFGAKDLMTPNIDRLSNEGIKFSRFYANSSVSSPSRAALLTGQYPHHAGVPHIIKAEAKGLAAEKVTLAEVLRANGYATGHVGKWHLGMNEGERPQEQGFDYTFGHLGGCIDNYSHYFYWNGPNRHDLWCNGKEIWREGQNFSDLMVDEAVNFLEEHKDEPFFLYFASNYPHYPLQGDAKWREYYKNTPHPRDKYAAMVSTIDEKIGKVIDKVNDLGIRENTIIIFLSDNGFSEEERTFFGGGSAGNLRGSKSSMYEGGIRVPAIMSWKGYLPEGKEYSDIAIEYDIFPTVLELCNIEYKGDDLDGSSMAEALRKGEKLDHDCINWMLGKKWAVLKNEYKLVSPSEDTIELYDMRVDMVERNNIADQHPDIVRELVKEHSDWVERGYRN